MGFQQSAAGQGAESLGAALKKGMKNVQSGGTEALLRGGF
jgi:hypothetical protein